MNNFADLKLFENTSLSDIFQEIHTNNKKTDTQITELINSLKPMLNSAGEVVMLMPTIKDLIEVNVKNNDQLVKIAGIAQRNLSSSPSNDIILESEIEDLVKQHQIGAAQSTKLIESGEQLKLSNEHAIH